MLKEVLGLMGKNRISIAIDGPAAAGKSTVAKIVAKKLSYLYIDTGAMYRALTWKAIHENVPVEDEEALDRLLQKTQIELKQEGEIQKVYVDGADVTEKIRMPEISKNVSAVAKHKQIREEMVKRQKNLAASGGVVMDGRDIGTHVLPDAEVKIFLKASVKERAKRRHMENLTKGIESNLEEIERDIALRDEMDSNRKVAPLKKAPDAIEIDSTHLTVEEVAERIMDVVRERID